MSGLHRGNWWAVLLRGILSIVFGILVLTYPGLTLVTGSITFVVLFAIFALADGIVMIVGSLMRRQGQWFWLLLLGIVGVIAGIVALENSIFFATFTLIAMVYIIGFRALVGGILEIVAGWNLRQDMGQEWLLILGGIFSVLFAIIIFLYPIATIGALVLVAGFFALIIGVMQLILAFNIRRWTGTPHSA